MEKRRLERFNLEVPATASITVDGVVEEKLDLMTRDVCSDGAYFKTAHTLPIGTEMEINLVLPIDKLKAIPVNCEKVMVRLSGKVLRIESDGVGVCFDETFDIRPLPNESML
jgi:hypothetical protein